MLLDVSVSDEIDTSLGEDAVCSLRRVAGNVPFCSRPAAYACRLECCDHIKVVCAAHRNIPESVYPKIFVCTQCHARSPGVAASWPV